MVSENKSKIMSKDPSFDFGKNIQWGKNITFGPNCKNVSIGFGAFIGDNAYFDVEELHIGDYFTIHHGSVIHGKRCVIGHNVWVGHYCILDALGGLLKLGNNVGVGAHSQLWSHMKFGDRMAGCNWHSFQELIVGDGAWFVGHCIVSPIVVEPRAMLLVGGVAVKNMKNNHIYAGSPAMDVTEKMGYQFRDMSVTEKKAIFSEYIDQYAALGNTIDFIKIVDGFERKELSVEGAHTFFELNNQNYFPRYTIEEYNFMKFLLYDRAKFLPIEIFFDLK